MSIRVLQIKARNKSQHRIQNSKKLYTQTSNKMGALSQCGSSKKRNIQPQLSQSVRLERANRGIGIMGGRVLNSSAKLTHKKIPNPDEISSTSYIEKLKLRASAQTTKTMLRKVNVRIIQTRPITVENAWNAPTVEEE